VPPVLNAGPATGLVIDRKTHTIRLTRDFDAPRAWVFESWTKPEHVSCWWDASGGILAVCEIDLRVGGAFKFVPKDHPEMPFTGIYREIAPPDRLVFEAIGAIGRVLLEESAGQTRMTVQIECRSDEQLEQYLKMGVDTGTAQTLDNLVAYMRKRSASVA
jgi:uncharacterized protein YndB with AHSA1/START domain